MTKRVNISISDALYERMQRVKGSMEKYVSEICQEALERAVELEELKQKDIPEREKLVMRLQKEKDEYSQRWREIGFNDGFQDAQHFHYKNFIWVAEAWRVQSQANILQSVEESLREASNGSLPNEKISTRLKQMMNETGFHRERYLEGWIQGVLKVWLAIKDEI